MKLHVLLNTTKPCSVDSAVFATECAGQGPSNMNSNDALSS